MHISRRASLHLLAFGTTGLALRLVAQIPNDGENLRSTLRSHLPAGWRLTGFEYIQGDPRPWHESFSVSKGYAATLENPDMFVNTGKGKSEHAHAAQSAVLRLWFLPLGSSFSLSRAQSDLAASRQPMVQSCPPELIGHSKHLLVVSDSGCGQVPNVDWIRIAFQLQMTPPGA
jgi:hypothetical protein